MLQRNGVPQWAQCVVLSQNILQYSVVIACDGISETSTHTLSDDSSFDRKINELRKYIIIDNIIFQSM
jgi:hypothetical protein